MSKALVMIVDDEEGIRETLSGILEDEGYESLTASSVSFQKFSPKILKP